MMLSSQATVCLWVSHSAIGLLFKHVIIGKQDDRRQSQTNLISCSSSEKVVFSNRCLIMETPPPTMTIIVTLILIESLPLAHSGVEASQL